MRLISHRGNLNGRNPEMENSMAYIDAALADGYDCEIDVRKDVFGHMILGHDHEQETISFRWLLERSERLWIHCKNMKALCALARHQHRSKLNFFWHECDKYTLTSQGWIWAYPGEDVEPNCHSVCVLPERKGMSPITANAVCSDIIKNYDQAYPL